MPPSPRSRATVRDDGQSPTVSVVLPALNEEETVASVVDTISPMLGGLVDELIVHLAPTLLGAGRPAVADLSITTLTDRLDLELIDVTPLISPEGPTDLRLTLRPRARPSSIHPA